MSLYGPIITGYDVSDAVTAAIKLWSPSYIGEVGAQAGFERCALPKFRSYTTVNELDGWAEDQTPGCIVIVPDMADEPVRDGAGGYTATWLVGVAAVVSARDRESVDRLVKLYVAALRTLLLQHPSLGSFDEDGNAVPFAQGMRWVGENYNEIDFNDSRSIAAGIVSMEVEVASVIEASGGLNKPPVDPCTDPGNYGIVGATPLSTKGLNG